QQSGAALADAFAACAENALVKFEAAVDIGDGDVQMVDALDFHGGLPNLSLARRLAAPGRERETIVHWADDRRALSSALRHQSGLCSVRSCITINPDCQYKNCECRSADRHAALGQLGLVDGQSEPRPGR